MDPIDSYAFTIPGFVSYDSDFEEMKKKLEMIKRNKKKLNHVYEEHLKIGVKSAVSDMSVDDVNESSLYFNKSNATKSKILEKNDVSKLSNSNNIDKNIKSSIPGNVEKQFVNELDNNNSNKLKDNLNSGQKLSKTQLSIDKSLKASNDSQPLNELILNYLELINSNLKEFVFKTAPQGKMIQCIIQRDKQGIDGGLHPTYYMYLEKNDKKRNFLLSARKNGFGLNVQYIISIDAINKDKNSTYYVGKLKPATNLNNFTLYDNGSNVKNDLDVTVRRELVSILYDSSIKNKGPRKMTVVIPSIDENGQPHEIRPITEKQTILECYKNKKWKNFLLLENKDPVWNEQTGSFALNFGGRVTESSVKNFQIIQKNNPTDLLMQFGKTGLNSFICDFTYPMCAIQAFGIALSSFDF